VPHLGVIAELAPPPESAASAGTLDLLPTEWEVLALIDGERDVRGVAQAAGHSDFEVAKTLFGLESAGVILLRDPGTGSRPRPSAMAEVLALTARAEDALVRRDLEDARGAAERAAALVPDDGGVHLLLGRVHLAAARPGDAAEALRRALRLDPGLVAAHRVLGYALAAAGRFSEAVEQWERWEQLAADSDQEAARSADVRRAKLAAQTLAAAGSGQDG